MADTIKTVKSSGGDYSSLSAWEAGQQKVIAAGDTEQAECYAFQDTTIVTIDGWTTVATGYIRIYTPTAERHNGTLGTGYRLVANAAFNRVLRINEDFVRLEGIAIRHSTTAFNGSENAIFNSNSGSTRDIRIEKCLITGGIQSINSSGGVLKVANCFIFTGGPTAFVSSFGPSAPNDAIYNCTAVAATNGITSSGGTCLVKNCYVSAASGTEFSSSGQTRTTCAHASSASWSNSTASIAYDTTNFTNVTAGSEDLHLVSGASATLKTGGTDLSADATFPFSDDIDGDTRSDWGIGADERAAAAGIVGPFIGGRLIHGGALMKGRLIG